MIQIKTIAISIATLAAVAVPASAGDHRDQKRTEIQYGVNLNLGNLHISARNPIRAPRYFRAPKVYIALEGRRNRYDHHFDRFEDSVRRDFMRSTEGSYRIVRNPRKADLVIRLDRNDWGKAFKHYVRAGKHGRYPDRYDTRTKMVNKVSHRLAKRAHNLSKRYYKNARYDNHDRYDDRRDRYDDRYDNRRDDGRRYWKSTKYRH